MCQCNAGHNSLDMVTPRNVLLSAFFKRSFAYHTVKVRMPVIITQTIDSLTRNKEEIAKKYGNGSQEELKKVIGDLSKFRYEIQTNKEIQPIGGEAKDVKFYNRYLRRLQAQGENTTYFNTIWLYAECFMYRKVREIFEVTKLLKEYDPYQKQKEEAYSKSIKSISKLGKHLCEVLSNDSADVKEEFIKLLKINLWGNKGDLSLSNGKVDEKSNNSLFSVDNLDDDLLVNESGKVWAALNAEGKSKIVDIILDNAGYELFTDLCIADFLTTKGCAQKFRFYIKTIPWFISDVTTPDFNWLLNQLTSSSDPSLNDLGHRWTAYVEAGTWTIESHDFWTLPVGYSQMFEIDPELYNKLSESKLAIFKGDLNYRKLLGEKNWDPMTPVEEALQWFHPTKLCMLRTLKADLVCGLPYGLAEKLSAESDDWMTSGKYGLIQFCDRVGPGRVLNATDAGDQ